jgi:ABC-type transport system involved in cytochrome bd biosynthesis, ATPase and permease components
MTTARPPRRHVRAHPPRPHRAVPAASDFHDSSCDQIYLLSKGQIEAAGIHRELLTQNPLYRHLHYLEFNEIAEQV